MTIDQLFPSLLATIGVVLLLMGVAVVDKQPRVRWGNWLLPEARVPKVKERARKLEEEPAARERFRAVFPLPTDASGVHSELGSRQVRRFG